MTTDCPPPRHEGVPLPRLSDQAAVELYLFVEHVFLLLESRYGTQIRRHFDAVDRDDLAETQLDLPLDAPLDDPPF